ncbi:MAG: exosortase/archaeosortase family protein [Chloroflexota bacterium]
MNLQASKRDSLNQFLLPLVSVLILGLISWPVWLWLWQEWMGNQYYSHGILIPLVTIFLIVQRMRNDETFTWQRNQGGIGLIISLIALAIFVVFFLVALNLKAYYLAAFTMIGMIMALIRFFGGATAFNKLLFPLGYLVLMVPLPFIERSTLPLALFTGVCSGGLAQFLGMDITIIGNSVTLPNADLVIGAQCSGINSLIALTALTALAAYLVDGPLWSKVLLVLLAVPMALVTNILRVSSLLFVARNLGAEAGFIFYHDYSGPIFFVLAMILLYPLARLLQFRNLRLDVI